MKLEQLEPSQKFCWSLTPISDLLICQIGAGGTGSWLAPHLARLTRVWRSRQMTVNYTIIDPDVIEEKNLHRQNFCPAELGAGKAESLAVRYSQACGIDITAITQTIQQVCKSGIDGIQATLQRGVPYSYNRKIILIGCVDNFAARIKINELMIALNSENYAYYKGKPVQAVWIDLGNYHNGGQCLVGTSRAEVWLERSQSVGGISALPSPAVQHPELLLPDTNLQPTLSCAELTLVEEQSLTINQTMAAIATSYLLKLVSSELRHFQTYLSLDGMVMHSTPLTKQNLEKYQNRNEGET